MTDPWQPDILGRHFEQCTLDLPSGAIATLVRYRPRINLTSFRRRTCAVLYVHGWSDYFFQTDLARFWHDRGVSFYALDLHNYGRSLRPGLVPGFVSDLTEYDEDLQAALDQMTVDREGLPLILMGHSTGGLTVSLWAARHPGMVSALILNSPWLEFQATGAARRLISPLLGFEARRHPLAPLPPLDRGYYARAVADAFDGRLPYNEEWRPRQGFPVTLAFLYAVLQGQATVEEGLELEVPTLVMLSDKSYLQPVWSDDVESSDIALNVDVVAHRALSLGACVTVIRVKDAMHDVVLSAPQPRQMAYERMRQWFRGYQAAELGRSPDPPDFTHEG